MPQPETASTLGATKARAYLSSEKIADRCGLHDALQSALALEHATIPAYLYALLSLKPGRNVEVAGILREVLMQEMLHMALVGNILNAVGATPKIGLPGFVPHYPGQLPGDVLPELTVSLRRCSIEHVRDVFMSIEHPHVPVDLAGRRALARLESYDISLSDRGEIENAADEVLRAPREFFHSALYDEHTIGWFYQRIAAAVIDLDGREELFTGDPNRQVAWPTAPGRLYRVTNADTALWAILEIVRQGEGTPTDPTTGPQPAPPPLSSEGTS
ncbi:rubrerythrin [Streptacidiphilus sp. MAP12-16]|uniref:ferritin-like domain-containing protein n=1 Tax=Streptacidiphilus sp. MAP12-16 TaxID=3156300 RepID=UPI0035133D13